MVMFSSNEPGGGVTPFSRHQAPGSRWDRRGMPLEGSSCIGIGGNVWDADGFLCGIVQQAGLPRVSADLACELFEMLLEPITTQVPFIPPEHSGRPSGTANRPAPGGTDLADLLAGGR